MISHGKFSFIVNSAKYDGAIGNKIVCVALAFQTGIAMGQSSPLRELNLASRPATEVGQRAEEFYSKSIPGEVVIPVQMLGAVKRPGVYHVPRQTDIVQILALAGGFNDNADPTKSYIRSRIGDVDRVRPVNLEAQLRGANTKAVILEANDVVVIDQKTPAISSNTLTIVGVVASLLSIIVSGIVVVTTLQK